MDIKRFTWDGRGGDSDVLASLTASPRYRESYLLPDSHLHDAETVHGPYRVAEITWEDFEGVATPEAEVTVVEFVSLYEPPVASDVIREVESAVLGRLHQARCYRLKRLAHAEHEWASVLWEFRELVVISPVLGEVVLVVMAID